MFEKVSSEGSFTSSNLKKKGKLEQLLCKHFNTVKREIIAVGKHRDFLKFQENLYKTYV